MLQHTGPFATSSNRGEAARGTPQTEERLCVEFLKRLDEAAKLR
jgi:hypothetical protein